MDGSGVEVHASLIHGEGVFAKRPFRVGERALPIDDSRVVTADNPLDPAKGELDYHEDYLGTHDVLMQYPERHINHCCEPNTFVRTFNGVRWVVAYREIAAGDEITYDYCINQLRGRGVGVQLWPPAMSPSTPRRLLQVAGYKADRVPASPRRLVRRVEAGRGRDASPASLA